MNNNLLIYGVNPVLKVASTRVDDILNLYVYKNNTNIEIKKIINLCDKNKIKYIDDNDLTLLLKEIKTKNKIAHQKVFARIKPKKEISLDDLINDPNFNFCMILDGVTDPNNLGAIIRNLVSFNLKTLIIPKDRSTGINESIYKTSVGEVEAIDLVSVTNLNETVKKLKKHGFWVYGFENEGNSLVWDMDYKLKVCFVLGGEASGIRSLLKKNLDFIVKIPISNNSLNVASSSAVVLYEYIRNKFKTTN